MQGSPYRPRLENLDMELIQRVLAMMCQIREGDLEAEHRGHLKRPQTHYSLASSNCQQIGRFLYALGHPLSEVRNYLSEAASYMHKVFELRGTQNPFPVSAVTTNRMGRNIKRQSLQAPESADYSLTNPADGLQGLFLALIVGDLQLARSIAEMMWDPPDAEYIHPKSDVCTTDQQHLAYAIKHVVLGDPNT